jgi:hypothetical protein
MSDALNALALAFGLLLVLKKVADMDRFYYLRLFLIIAVLSYITILFFGGCLLLVGGSGLSNCMPTVDQQF